MIQWQRLEEQNLEGTNIHGKMIIVLASFINVLQKQQKKIIVGIGDNESNDRPKNGVYNASLYKFIDVISQEHGIRKDPNTY